MASGGDISPFMLRQGVHQFDGDLVLADSYYMPFKDHTFDALAFTATFAYHHDPVRVIREAVRVGKYGIVFGVMKRNTPKVLRRRVQQKFGRNPYYVTASFYTPEKLKATIKVALPDREYTIKGKTTGLPKWFPVQEWNARLGDFFGMHVKPTDVE